MYMIYLDYPACCGLYEKAEHCCCSNQCQMCKMSFLHKTNEAGHKQKKLCILSKSVRSCVVPRVCCKNVRQYCCYQERCSCPCDAEVPCVLTLIPFCTVCFDSGFKLACFETLSNLKSSRQQSMIAPTPAVAVVQQQPMMTEMVIQQQPTMINSPQSPVIADYVIQQQPGTVDADKYKYP